MNKNVFDGEGDDFGNESVSGGDTRYCFKLETEVDSHENQIIHHFRGSVLWCDILYYIRLEE